MTLKTSAAIRDKLAARILELHPWASGPEITATPVEWAIDSYVMWVEKTTTTTE